MLTKINDHIYIAGQLRIADIPLIQQYGIRSVICHRPDHEEKEQIPFADLAQAMRDAGILHTYHQPVVMSQINEEHALILNHILHETELPALLFCRTGTRCMALWATLNILRGISASQAINEAVQHGFNLSSIQEQLKKYNPFIIKRFKS